MPRPQVSEDLASQIRQLHRETQGEEASSLQEALDTVVQLATREARSSQTSSDPDGWYPGKYAGKIISSLEEASSNVDPSRDSSGQGRRDRRGLAIDQSPEDAAVFKTRLDQNGTVTVPEVEQQALNLNSDMLVQVIIYQINKNNNKI